MDADVFKGVALVAAFVGFLATCAALIARMVGLDFAGGNEPLLSGPVYHSPLLRLWRARHGGVGDQQGVA